MGLLARGADLAPQHRVDRPRRRRLVRGRRRGRLARRPARRGRALADLHLGAARRADRDPRLPRGDARDRGRPPERARRGAPVRRRPRRRIAAHHARRAQPQPPRRPRRPAAASSPVSATRSRSHSTRSPSACPPGTACASRCRPRTGRGCGPPPKPVTLTLHARPGDGPDARAARRGAGRLRAARVGGAAGGRDDQARPDDPHATRHDQATGAHELRFEWDVGGHRRLVDSAIEMNDTHVTTYRIVDGDPLSASVRVQCSSALGRGAWRTRIHTDSEMTATAAEFVVRHRLDAYEGEQADLLALLDARVPARRVLKPVGHPALEGGDQVLAGEQQLAVLEDAGGHPALHGLHEHAILGADLVVERHEVGDPRRVLVGREEVVEHARGAAPARPASAGRSTGSAARA